MPVKAERRGLGEEIRPLAAVPADQQKTPGLRQPAADQPQRRQQVGMALVGVQIGDERQHEGVRRQAEPGARGGALLRRHGRAHGDAVADHADLVGPARLADELERHGQRIADQGSGQPMRAELRPLPERMALPVECEAPAPADQRRTRAEGQNLRRPRGDVGLAQERMHHRGAGGGRRRPEHQRLLQGAQRPRQAERRRLHGRDAAPERLLQRAAALEQHGGDAEAARLQRRQHMQQVLLRPAHVHGRRGDDDVDRLRRHRAPRRARPRTSATPRAPARDRGGRLGAAPRAGRRRAR